MAHAAQTQYGKTADSTIDEVQVVEFILGNDTYAVNLFDVKEIVESFKITPLPHAGSHIKGIIDLRGEITTVIDLKSILHIPKRTTEGAIDTRFIVLDDKASHTKIGILVDDVTSVLTIPVSDIDHTTTSGDENSYILGIIKKSSGNHNDTRKELVIWIDIKVLIQSAGV